MSNADFAPSRRRNKASVDVEKFVPGQTQVHLDGQTMQSSNCCGNLLCMFEYTVDSVGTFKDAEGNETQLVKLSNGLFVTADMIDYTLE